MKRRLLVIVPLFMTLTGQSTLADDSVRYFTKFVGVISPLLEFSLSGEVTAEEASNHNHYVVKYDDEGRYASIKYFKTSGPSTDAYYNAHEVRYTFEQNRRLREYFDTDGKPMAMSRHYYRSANVQKEEYNLDGDVTRLHLYGVDGERVEAGTGTYVFEGQTLEGRGLIQRLYRKDGTPGIIFNYLPFEVSLLTLNRYGFIRQILNYDEETGQVVMNNRAGFAEMRIEFDQFGNELGWSFRDPQGGLVNRLDYDGGMLNGTSTMLDGGYARHVYEFDWTNRQLGQYLGYTMRFISANGSPICKQQNTVCAERYEFDEKENFVLAEKFGRGGEYVFDPSAGFARFEVDYDKLGRRTESRVFGADGKLRQTGVAKRTFSYSEDGTQSAQSYDHEGNPVEAN